MSPNICLIQEKCLIDRLQSLKIKGEVIGKKIIASSANQPEKRIVVIRFRSRIIEKETDESEFHITEIGEQCGFTPPVPDRDSCNYHLFVWSIVGLAACMLAIWAITSHFYGRTVTLLSIAVAGWISIIIWARINSHEQNKCLRDLKMEVEFFETEGD